MPLPTSLFGSFTGLKRFAKLFLLRWACKTSCAKFELLLSILERIFNNVNENFGKTDFLYYVFLVISEGQNILLISYFFIFKKITFPSNIMYLLLYLIFGSVFYRILTSTSSLYFAYENGKFKMSHNINNWYIRLFFVFHKVLWFFIYNK